MAKMFDTSRTMICNPESQGQVAIFAQEQSRGNFPREPNGYITQDGHFKIVQPRLTDEFGHMPKINSKIKSLPSILMRYRLANYYRP